MFANEVQNDTAVDIPGRFRRSHFEVVQINRMRGRGCISIRQVTTIGHDIDYVTSEMILNR